MPQVLLSPLYGLARVDALASAGASLALLAIRVVAAFVPPRRAGG